MHNLAQAESWRTEYAQLHDAVERLDLGRVQAEREQLEREVEVLRARLGGSSIEPSSPIQAGMHRRQRLLSPTNGVGGNMVTSDFIRMRGFLRQGVAPYIQDHG